MKSKLQGSKKIAYVLVGAGAVALTGIAFSAWVITQAPTPTDVGNITVTVGEVQDHTVVITNAIVSDGYGTLSFDASSGDTEGPITAGDGSNEQLTFAIQFDIEGALASSTTFNSWYGGFKTSLKIVTDDTSASSATINAAGEALNSAISSEYLVAPISGEITYTKPSTGIDHTASPTGETGLEADFSASETTLSVTLTFNFSWGSAFNSSNPGFTTASDNSTLETIKEALTKLKSASGAHLNVTLTPFLQS